MIKFNLSLLLAFGVFLSGCVSKKTLVQPGQSRKLHTPSGVYSDVYVDEIEFDSPVITLSSPSADSLQVTNYFNKTEVNKILIARGNNGIILSFSGDASDPQNISIISVQGSGDSRKKIEYELIGK